MRWLLLERWLTRDSSACGKIWVASCKTTSTIALCLKHERHLPLQPSQRFIEWLHPRRSCRATT